MDAFKMPQVIVNAIASGISNITALMIVGYVFMIYGFILQMPVFSVEVLLSLGVPSHELLYTPNTNAGGSWYLATGVLLVILDSMYKHEKTKSL